MKNSFKKALFIAFLSGVSLQAMEQKELSTEEAKNLYWDSAFPKDKYKVEVLDYPTYRANMMRAIPYLTSIQSHYHNPLGIAVKARDLEFTKFLLDHGADPLATDMSGRNALQIFEDYAQPKERQSSTTEADTI